MPQQEIKVIEYQCSRCNWKWIARKNGNDKPEPSFCPRCKTWMWNIERKNDMYKFHYWQTRHYAAIGMIWDESASKWKKPSNESEKEKLNKVLDDRLRYVYQTE